MVRSILVVAALIAAVVADTTLRFKTGSTTFKIVQFADMHYSNGELAPCSDILPEQRPCNDKNTTAFMSKVLDAEQPDLVVFTGDNLIGSALDATEAIKQYSQPVIDRQIPWAIVFGNHDDEGRTTRTTQMNIVTALPYAISEIGPENINGVGNYVVRIASSDGTQHLFHLYFLDSGAYSKFNGISGYDWIHPSQLTWFAQKAAEMRTLANGQIRPAFAYHHIPLPEMNQVTDKVGDEQEGVYDANVNSGFFAAMKEAADVKATFVGHDHVNDYCGLLYGIRLCYGGGVGYGAYGKAGWPRRSRVTEISNNGNAARTWLRLDDSNLSKIREIELFSQKK